MLEKFEKKNFRNRANGLNDIKTLIEDKRNLIYFYIVKNEVYYVCLARPNVKIIRKFEF